MMKKTAIFIALVALVQLLPLTARAQMPAGTSRLHLESSILSFYKGRVNYDDDDIKDGSADGFALGIGKPRLGMGFGYTIIENFVVGGRLQLSLNDVDGLIYNVLGKNAFQLALLPYVEYMFLTGVFRPFVTGFLGLEGLVYDNLDRVPNVSVWTFMFGGGGGGHIFLTSGFSIDLTLLIAGHFGGGEISKSDDLKNDSEFSIALFEFSALFGLSGWF